VGYCCQVQVRFGVELRHGRLSLRENSRAKQKEPKTKGGASVASLDLTALAYINFSRLM
jgi:hypothetical protein